MKKAQGLSLNTIIIAAIVLIVLIVLWAIFTGRMGKFTEGLKSEDTKAQEAAKTFEQKATGGEATEKICPVNRVLTAAEAPCKCAPATDQPTCAVGRRCSAAGCT